MPTKVYGGQSEIEPKEIQIALKVTIYSGHIVSKQIIFTVKLKNEVGKNINNALIP